MRRRHHVMVESLGCCVLAVTLDTAEVPGETHEGVEGESGRQIFFFYCSLIYVFLYIF